MVSSKTIVFDHLIQTKDELENFLGKSPSQRAGITDCYKEFFITFLENYRPVTKNKQQERDFQTC